MLRGLVKRFWRIFGSPPILRDEALLTVLLWPIDARRGHHVAPRPREGAWARGSIWLDRSRLQPFRNLGDRVYHLLHDLQPGGFGVSPGGFAAGDGMAKQIGTPFFRHLKVGKLC